MRSNKRLQTQSPLEQSIDLYEQLLRKMVSASELEYTLKTRAHIDVGSAEELTRACTEVEGISGCLAEMIITLRDKSYFRRQAHL